MSSYPTISDIEMRWRASGSGVCVIVEGQTEQDDAWFYNRWFGNQAREITFFPQDGWTRVVDAVVERNGWLICKACPMTDSRKWCRASLSTICSPSSSRSSSPANGVGTICSARICSTAPARLRI